MMLWSELVWLVDIIDSDDGKVSVISKVAECCTRSRFQACFLDLLLREV